MSKSVDLLVYQRNWCQNWRVQENRTQAVHDSLVESGMLVPVILGGLEERTWLDCDLASLAENRIGEVQDPRTIDETRRARWLARVVDEAPVSLKSRWFERCYWIVYDSERVGCMALTTESLGNSSINLSSFYVFPSYRGRGIGKRAMEDLMAAVASQGLRLRLSTSWCWQATVKFYLKLGLWVYMWKRDLDLFWDKDTPMPIIEVGAQEASLSVRVEDSIVTLERARRCGDRLELETPSDDLGKDKRLGGACWHASSTLSLALALAGWPLVRSAAQWQENYYAEGGPPEALAYKITLWEAWERKHDRIVITPRIPGLEYPTWEEYEAGWAANRERYERQKS